MNLSASEIDVLTELSRITTGCATPECERLALLGLVVTGRSRFGEWAKATEAGRQYVGRTLTRGGRATPPRGSGDTEQLLRGASDGVFDGSGHSPSIPLTGDLPLGSSQGKTKRGPRGMARHRREASTSPLQHEATPRPAAKGRASIAPKAAAAAQGTSQTSTTDAREIGPSPANPARALRRRATPTSVSRREATGEGATSTAPSSGLSPNAVRVITGARVTYFPLSAYEALNGSKQRVYTSNRLFRATALAASGADRDVLFD